MHPFDHLPQQTRVEESLKSLPQDILPVLARTQRSELQMCYRRLCSSIGKYRSSKRPNNRLFSPAARAFQIRRHGTELNKELISDCAAKEIDFYCRIRNKENVPIKRQARQSWLFGPMNIATENMEQSTSRLLGQAIVH